MTLSGNYLVDAFERQQEMKENICPSCDCSKAHRCINCDKVLYRADCEKNNGFCDYCSDQTKGESNEK